MNKKIRVKQYYKKNGTKVRSHNRTIKTHITRKKHHHKHNNRKKKINENEINPFYFENDTGDLMTDYKENYIESEKYRLQNEIQSLRSQLTPIKKYHRYKNFSTDEEREQFIDQLQQTKEHNKNISKKIKEKTQQYNDLMWVDYYE